MDSPHLHIDCGSVKPSWMSFSFDFLKRLLFGPFDLYRISEFCQLNASSWGPNYWHYKPLQNHQCFLVKIPPLCTLWSAPSSLAQFNRFPLSAQHWKWAWKLVPYSFYFNSQNHRLYCFWLKTHHSSLLITPLLLHSAGTAWYQYHWRIYILSSIY